MGSVLLRSAHRDDYFWTPDLAKDYWLHTGPSGIPLSLNESQVIDFWHDIETIWHDHLRTALRGHNDVPKCLPIYQLHFASEEHPTTRLRVTVWRSMYQPLRNVSYLIVNENATTVLHRLHQVRRLDQLGLERGLYCSPANPVGHAWGGNMAANDW